MSSEGSTSSQDEEPRKNIARPDQMLNVKDANDSHSQQPVVERCSSAGTTTEVDVEVAGNGGSSANALHRNIGEPSGCAASHLSEYPFSTQKPSTSSAAAANETGHRTLSLKLRFTCDFCPSEFDSHEDMCEHAREVHFGCTLESSDRIFLICICGKVYFSKQQMSGHSYTKHGLEKCDVCLDKQKIRTNVYHHQIDHF